MTTILKVLGVAAWAGLAIANATPANAIYISSSTGEYATCTGQWFSNVHDDCGMTLNYFQMIKLQSTGCNAGGCADQGGGGGVDAIYSVGRKPAYFAWSCSGSSANAWELGDCSC